MSIMITGGTGFLGSYLVRHLVQEKGIMDVVLFDQYPNEGRIAEVRDQVTLEQGDVLQPYDLLRVMERYRVDRVVHLAFILGEPDAFKPVNYLNVQCMGTANVFEAARLHGVTRVVYASSAAVYGHNPPSLDEEVSEADAPTPNTLYGACKLWGEHVAEVYTERYGLDIISLRPCSVFGLGRGQRGSYASGLAPTPEQAHFMVLPEQAALGEAVEMPPDDIPYDWIYAADAAEAWYRAVVVENPVHRVYNLRSERRYMGEMTSHLRHLLPEARISVGTEQPRNLYLMNHDRLVNDLGFKARYTMETGMVDYLNRVRRDAGFPPVNS